MKKQVLGAIAATSLLTAGLLYVTFDDQPEAVARASAAAAPPPVQVIEPVGRSLPETASYTGRLAAIEHVDLRPRVGGYLAAVRFREGGIVKRGQVLFEIDARPYEAAVSRAKAQLLQAQARRTLAQRKATRARTLRADDVISQAELDGASADEADGTAAVEAARAWLHATSIDLADTKIRAPIDGRIGEALVTKGNLVGSASLLATLVSVDPLHVEFDMDEPTFRRLTAGTNRGDAAAVQVTIGDEPAGTTATLDFLANRVDPTTGTARARAVLANADGRLTPGLFARLRLETGAARPAVLIRDEAIGTSAQGRYVLVVKPDGVVEMRRIELGESIDGLRIIKSGLVLGDRVILKGMARPGMTVTPELVPTNGGAS